MKNCTWLKMVVLLMVASIAMAQTAASVDKMIDEGKFDQAFTAAQKVSGAEGLVLAAKSASLFASYEAKDSDKPGWYGRAEEAAQKAIATDKNNPEAYFELARAQGRLAQYRGILESLGLATGIKENLDRTLKLNPKHAGARVALALWHHSLASKGVGWLYGANGGASAGLFEEAIKLEPSTIIHKVEYAGVLAQQNRKADAIKQLEAALAIAPKTAADKFDLERAKKELVGLNKP